MSGSITNALVSLEGSDSASSAQLLWDRYFERLCAFAEGRIYQRFRRVISPDEIASDAFLALVHGVQQKKFDKVRKRDEFWQMLMLISSRLVIQAHKHHGRAKRGGSRKRLSTSSSNSPLTLAELLEEDITPDSIVELKELSDRLLELLATDQLRQIAVWRMAGYSTEEIAEKLQVSSRTIERKLGLVRNTWIEFQGENVV